MLEPRQMLSADDTLAGATPVPFTYGTETTQSDTVDPVGDVDLYSLQLAAGDRLVADIEAQSTGSSLDTLLRLFDSTGNELSFNDDDGTGSLDSLIEFTVPADGTYYVGVSDFGNFFYDPNVEGSGGGSSTGVYDLKLLVSPPLSDDTIAGATPTNLASGVEATTSADIDPLGDVDLYAVSMAAGDTLDARIEAQANGSPLDSFLRVFDIAGNELTSNDDNAGLDSALSFTATEAGTFFVGVSDAGNFFYDPNVEASGGGSSTGAYDLKLLLTQAPLPPDGNDTLVNATVTPFIRGVEAFQGGAIADALDVDLYRLTLAVGDTLSLDVDAQIFGFPLDAALRLFDATGAELASNDDSDGLDPALLFNVTTAGVYFVGVSGAPNVGYDPQTEASGVAGSIGEYTLKILVKGPPPVTDEVEANNDVDSSNTIAPNTTIGGSIGVAGDRDVFAITLTEPGRLTATSETTVTGGGDTRLTLLGPNGQPLVTSDDAAVGNVNPLIEQHLPAGTYYLSVSGVGAATGNYFLFTDFIAATPPFAEIATPGFPAAIISAFINDLSGPFVADLVVVNRFSGDINVLLGLGDGTYAPAISTAVGPGLAAVASGYFNQDNFTDLAVTNPSSGEVFILLGNGDGSFNAQATILVGSEPVALVVSAFNNDNALDLAVVNAGSGTVTILTGDGNGTFSVSGEFAVGDRPEAITHADLNGDSRLDLLVANRGSDDVSILLGNADGTFGDQARFSVGDEPTSLTLGNFGGGAELDLAVANAQSDDVSLLIGLGGGNFNAESRLDVRSAPVGTAAGDFRSTIATNDFNGDGQLDLAVANSVDPTVTVALGLGNSAFASGRIVAVTGQPFAIALEDLDLDGRLDFATANGFGDSVSVRLGLGDGTFQAAQRFAVNNSPLDVAVGDFDSDGRLDLATATSGFTSLLMGNGDGTMGEASRLAAGDATSIVVGDFNGDGRLDMATANGLDDNISVLLGGLGDGGFDTIVNPDPSTGDFPLGIATTDLNGDGVLDLATANFSSRDISIFFGRGDGKFNPETRLAAGNSPFAILAEDINADGLADLVVANSGDNDLSVRINLGGGAFDVDTRLPVGKTPHRIAIGDLNVDGRKDLVVANYEDDSVSVLLALAGGGFASATQYAVGHRPQAVVVADLNGDLINDIGSANEVSNDVSVLRNLGDGSFAPQVSFPVGDSPTAIVSGDFNGDGRADLAVANVVSKDVTMLLGRGDGSFVSPDKFASTAFGATPLFADLNRDLITDSVVVNQSGNIIVRLGRADVAGTFDPPRTINAAAPARAISLVKVGNETLIAAIDRAADGVKLYALAANGTPTVRANLATFSQPVRIAAADMNGDLREDLVVAHAGGNGLGLFLANSAGNFVLQPAIDSAADPSDVKLIDVNGDSRRDIIVADQVAGAVNLIMNSVGGFLPGTDFRAATGQAGFEQAGAGAPTLLSRDGIASLLTADFNEDGTPDLVAVERGANAVSVLFGKVGGGYTNPRPILVGSSPVAAQAADFDGDQNLDLAILNQGSRTIDILKGDGHGNFTKLREVPAGNQPTGLTVRNVDADVAVDLVIGNHFGDVLTLFGNGDGTFQPFTRAGRNVAIGVGDLDGDGQDDWVVTNETRDRVAVAVNDGNPALVQDGTGGVVAPGAVKMADLNGDNRLDMIVANGGANNVQVFLGQGGGQFAAAQSFHAGTDPAGITVADVNGDRRLDVIVSNFGSNDVSVLLNTGDASLLRPGVRLDVGQGPTATEVVLKTDGSIDGLLVTNSLSNEVRMLDALGGGFFDDQAPTVFATGNLPQSTMVGNFDRRPGIDFVTINTFSNSVTMYSGFNTALSTRTDFASGGSRPVSAVARDFNLDGALDLVIANNGNGAISILLGGDAGLIQSDIFFSPDVQHPTAVALAEGNELRLLVADEGDELVSVFGRQTLPVPTNLNVIAIIRSTAESLSSSLFGSATGGLQGLLASFTAFVISLVGESGDSERGSGGEVLTTADLEAWLKTLSTTISAGERLIESALETLSKPFGDKLPNDGIGAVESLFNAVLPATSLRAIGELLNVILNPNAKGPPQAAIDKSLEELGADTQIEDAVEAVTADTQLGSEPPTAVEAAKIAATPRKNDASARDAVFARLDKNSSALEKKVAAVVAEESTSESLQTAHHWCAYVAAATLTAAACGYTASQLARRYHIFRRDHHVRHN